MHPSLHSPTGSLSTLPQDEQSGSEYPGGQYFGGLPLGGLAADGHQAGADE